MHSNICNTNILDKSTYTVILTIQTSLASLHTQKYLQYKHPWYVYIHSNTYNTNILGKSTYAVILTIQTPLINLHTQ
jgi:hypothetical protein